MPPTDPRFLDADEELVIHDLLLRMALDTQRRERGDPGEVQAAELAASAGAVEGMIARKSAFLADPEQRRALETALGKVGRPRPRTIRIGRVKVME